MKSDAIGKVVKGKDGKAWGKVRVMGRERGEASTAGEFEESAATEEQVGGSCGGRCMCFRVCVYVRGA